MKIGKLFHFCRYVAGGLLAVALVCALTGCPAQQTVNNTNTAPPAQPAPTTYIEEPPDAVADGMIYYPEYEVYYDPGPGVYWWYAGGGWVSGPEPAIVSIEVLHRSSGVRMGFHGSPESHHAEIVRQYPHDWRPAERDRRGP